MIAANCGRSAAPTQIQMQIVCPSCASRYEIDGTKIGPEGRKVRCASCRTLWHAIPEPELPPPPDEDEMRAMLEAELASGPVEDTQPIAEPDMAEAEAEPVAAQPVVEPLPEAPPRRRPPPPPRKPVRSSHGLRGPLGFAAAGLVLIGLCVWQREAVVRVAPQLAGLFHSAGLSVNIVGLRLGAAESGLRQDAEGRFLVVEADITNIARSDRTVPPVALTVRDAAGQALYSWTAKPPRDTLEPSELVRFRTRLASPPEGAKTVELRFGAAEAAGVAAAH